MRTLLIKSLYSDGVQTGLLGAAEMGLELRAQTPIPLKDSPFTCSAADAKYGAVSPPSKNNIQKREIPLMFLIFIFYHEILFRKDIA